MAMAHPPPLPSKDWAGGGLMGMGQNGTHIGQVLKASAQGLPCHKAAVRSTGATG